MTAPGSADRSSDEARTGGGWVAIIVGFIMFVIGLLIGSAIVAAALPLFLGGVLLQMIGIGVVNASRRARREATTTQPTP